jgi:hypothetical protein
MRPHNQRDAYAGGDDHCGTAQTFIWLFVLHSQLLLQKPIQVIEEILTFNQLPDLCIQPFLKMRRLSWHHNRDLLR